MQEESYEAIRDMIVQEMEKMQINSKTRFVYINKHFKIYVPNNIDI